jgi:RNA polymerase sigma factor (sigma-70 family)
MPPTDPPPSEPEPQAGPPPTLRALLASNLAQIEAIVRQRMPNGLRDKESATDVVDSVCGDLLADEARFVFRGQPEFHRFLDTVVANKLRERLRFHRRLKRDHLRQVPAPDSELQRAPADEQTPSQAAILRERYDLAERALVRLPAHYQEVIRRTRFLGESYAQVAAGMQRTVPSLRNLLHRALVKLGVEMELLQAGNGAAPPRAP